MDAPLSSHGFLFERFLLDRRAGGLFHYVADCKPEPVPLGSRALDLLCTLLARSGELVRKDDIIAAVWPDTVVGEANLTVQISALRRALDQGRSGDSCIQTVVGRGYRFVLGVARTDRIGQEMLAPLPLGPVEPQRHRRADARAASAVVPVASPAIDGWWLPEHRVAPGSGTPAPPAQIQSRRQSAIILPFENSSGDPAQDNVAAWLTRDLTDRIVRARDGPVVPGVTASAYRGKSVDLQAIGRQYDVHFALLGSARRDAGRLIVSATVYETAGGTAPWSQQFDLPDDPNERTAIAQAIYESYWKATVDVEADRALRDRPENLDKRDLLLIALSTRLASPTKEHILEKLSLTERALALDPDDLQGLERQARWYSQLVLQGYSPVPAADLAIAQRAADRALAINCNHLLALRAKSAVLHAQGKWVEAEAVLRRALTLQPTEAMRHYELGEVMMAEGRHPEGLDSFRTAKRFAGGDDPVYSFDANIALANLALGQFSEAIAMARSSLSVFPPDTGRLSELPWLALIAATCLSGADEMARAELWKFLANSRSWRSMAEIKKWPAFAANPNLLEGLRHAGMPAQ